MATRIISAPTEQTPTLPKFPVLTKTLDDIPEQPEIVEQNESVSVQEVVPAHTTPLTHTDTNEYNKKKLVFPILGGLAFFVGLYLAMTSKTAKDFDSFYWAIIQSNVLMTWGIVILYTFFRENTEVIKYNLGRLWRWN